MRVLHGPLLFVRNALVNTVEYIIKISWKLEKRSAMPPGRFEDIACASISLVSEGFFEGLDTESIKLKRDTG